MGKGTAGLPPSPGGSGRACHRCNPLQASHSSSLTALAGQQRPTVLGTWEDQGDGDGEWQAPGCPVLPQQHRCPTSEQPRVSPPFPLLARLASLAACYTACPRLVGRGAGVTFFWVEVCGKLTKKKKNEKISGPCVQPESHLQVSTAPCWKGRVYPPALGAAWTPARKTQQGPQRPNNTH